MPVCMLAMCLTFYQLACVYVHIYRLTVGYMFYVFRLVLFNLVLFQSCVMAPCSIYRSVFTCFLQYLSFFCCYSIIKEDTLSLAISSGNQDHICLQ